MSGPHDRLDVHPPPPAVADAVARALAEDLLPIGDLTSALVAADLWAELAVVARADGVVAGERCAEQTYALLDGRVEVVWLHHDGSAVVAGDVVAEIRGPLRAVLTGERTALNFLCHLSGIATQTRRFVDAACAASSGVRILDTRKTTPGLRSLEKAAVRAGGGHNHRASLSEGVLVKDNHLGGMAIADAVARARQRWPGRMVEVECDRAEQVTEACRAGATVVLLDNMTPDEAAVCVSLARSEAPGTLVEVSGRVSLEAVAAYAAAGVDLVSVGALTHSAPVLDLGLDLRSTWPAGA